MEKDLEMEVGLLGSMEDEEGEANENADGGSGDEEGGVRVDGGSEDEEGGVGPYPSLVKPKPNSTNQFVLCRIRKNDKGKRKLRTAEEDNETDTPVQSQNKRQRPQQVTSFEEFIGNCTPMSDSTGIGGSVSYLPTGLTQSQPDSQFHGGGDGDALMSDFSNLDTAQPFTDQALGSYAVCNQERASDVNETQQGLGLTDNNFGPWPSPFGSEEDQVNAFDFSIDYDLLIHLINCDDGPPQSSTAQFMGMGMKNTTSASSEDPQAMQKSTIFEDLWLSTP
ncbi:hypothetical protein ACE6H2_015089 [Prunus campanulata]